MSNVTNTVEIDLLDVLSGNYVVPHHKALGVPSENQSDTPVEVRMVDVPVYLNVYGHKLKVEPGDPRSNLEYIQYVATLMADALHPRVWCRLVQKATVRTRKIDLSELLVLIASDSLPNEWFLSYRDQLILKDNILLYIGDEHETLPHGTSWHDLLNYVTVLQRKHDIEIDQHIRKASRDMKGERYDISEFISTPSSRRDRPECNDEKNPRMLDNTDISDFLRQLG